MFLQYDELFLFKFRPTDITLYVLVKLIFSKNTFTLP